jgi:ABC-type phosphate/phosphonate transport system substrate-binding protein
MPPIATLPMYDWPERRAETDARWAGLRDAFRAEGFDAPEHLTRGDDPAALWLSPDLLIGETCSQPLATFLDGKVRYVATPVHDAPGCGRGTYRSAVIRRKPGADMPAPKSDAAVLEPEILTGRFAANEPGSMSGYVTLVYDCEDLGLPMPAQTEILWTGAHRESIRAVSEGRADYALIDCVSWQLARQFERASGEVYVAGWTSSRPGLPLITSMAIGDEELQRMRRAVMAAMEAVVLDRPFLPSRLPDRQP